MKIRLVLADTGRSDGGALNVLNAGWTATTAVQFPGGGWTLPGQALAVFLEAASDQLNRPYTLKLELVDTEGKLVQFARLDDVAQEVQISAPVIVQPVPGAPSEIPGSASLLLDLAAGTLRIPAPRHRYTWRASIDDDDRASDEISFWVNEPTQVPVVGSNGAISPADLPHMG